MSYFIRALCTSAEAPKLSDVQRWLKEQGSAATIEGPDLDSDNWEQATLSYKAGKAPILVECNRDSGGASLLREELEEFYEMIEDVQPSAGKKQVVAHLRATNFIVACQLQTSDIDDDGYDANGDFLSYFEDHCGGMVLADGEGFYRGEDLLLELD
jgi:hypothetical protein